MVSFGRIFIPPDETGRDERRLSPFPAVLPDSPKLDGDGPTSVGFRHSLRRFHPTNRARRIVGFLAFPFDISASSARTDTSSWPFSGSPRRGLERNN